MGYGSVNFWIKASISSKDEDRTRNVKIRVILIV